MLTTKHSPFKHSIRARYGFLILIALSSLVLWFALGSRSPLISAKQNSENSRKTLGIAATTVSQPSSINHAPLGTGDAKIKAGGLVADYLSILQQSNSNERAVSLTFDDLSAGTPPYFFGATTINNLYADIKFSSPAGSVFVYPGSYFENSPSSRPNVISPGVPSAPLTLNFPQPVNNLIFSIVGEDDYGTIGGLSWCQKINGAVTCSQPQSVSGIGAMGNYNALVFDFGRAGINNLTQVSFVPVSNDPDGLAYDDISFTVPAQPTPTPTPTPPPGPQAPRLLTATPGDEEVSLQWTASLGAECQPSQDPNHHCAYKVKQVTQTGFPVNGGTAIVSPSQTNYTYRSLSPNVKTYFAVSAVNSFLQESPDSNILSATPTHNCGVSPNPFPRPSPTPWDGGGWHLESEVSDRDGLVIRNVYLNGRLMAAMMSLPYFEIKTSTMTDKLRGELTPDNSDPNARLRTRLVGYDAKPIYSVPNHISAIDIKATYAVDNLSSDSKSCLFINQEYLFKETVPGEGCELSGTLPCSRFFPKVSYNFVSRDNERLESITLPERLHFKVLDNEGHGATGNTVGAFKDCDSVHLNPGTHLVECDQLGGGPVFSHKDNPVHWEQGLPILQNGVQVPINIGWDNYHQSARPDYIIEPPAGDPLHGIFGGGPDCVHIHWRWGAEASIAAEFLGRGRFGQGRVLGILPGSNQDLMAGVVLYKQNEIHPQSFESLKPDPVEKIRRFPGNDMRADFNNPYDVVFWYIGTGHRDYDEFFNHGGFFNPNLGVNLQRGASSNNLSSQNQSASSDGPTSVTFGYLYKEGGITFTQIDPATVGPLPNGYVVLNSFGHNITTDAVYSGQNVVSFSVPSVTNQTEFDALRILHAEQDPFDPDGVAWVDRTVLPPDPQAPDFGARRVNAKVGDLGKFVIAIFSQPPSTSADLSLNITHSPEPVVADNELVYTLTATNSGPQQATGVGLFNALSQDLGFVSAFSSQGSCKFRDGTLYCKLGTLANGANATVIVTVKPTEGSVRFPDNGLTIRTEAQVAANENDPNAANNNAVNDGTALPSSNARPLVSITSPTFGSVIVGSANVSITAQASDSDGSVSRVDFYDGQTPLGSGVQTSTANQYRLDWSNVGFGLHVLRAVATDNGGKTEVSNPVNILVNGPATINITSPVTGTVLPPGSNVPITAVATTPNGSITKVEFVTDGLTIGEGTSNGSNQYQITWANVPRGNYVLSAIATDGNGVQSISAPVNVAAESRPTVSISKPVDGKTFPSAADVIITAQAQGSIINKLDFYADGAFIGTGIPGNDSYTFTWKRAPDGIHSLTAVAIDDLGVSTTSAPITIGVNTPSPRAGEFIWFDDALPAGAVKHADGDVDWYWVDANPGAFSGTKAHQSRNFGQLDPPNSIHQHYFDSATATLPINAGDKLFTYVFLDVNNMPREIMLQWKDASGWEHRAYWGANNIGWGTDGTSSRRYMGALPLGGTWVRLEVPASDVSLEGSTLNGMAFTLDAGRATFDLAGKTVANAAPPPITPAGDFVWFDEGLPTGAVPAAVNDTWNWVNHLHYTGQTSHMSTFDPSSGVQFRSHSFTGAQTPMQINPGDVLFTYVYLGDPDTNHDPYTPNEIMLQWYDGTSWEHRAFWGINYIGQRISNMGVQGTDGQRYMGGMPAARGWYRLEVPASYVGLEGKSVSGMAFSAYRDQTSPYVAWDRSGKSAALTTVPLTLSSTSGVWRSYSNSYGYAVEMPDVAPAEHQLQKISFWVHPNQAAGTVPMYRFRKSGYEYFYTQCRTCPGSDWQYDGIAFYVYPDASTPGTVPLYLYHDNRSKYFLTIDQNEATGMTLDGTWAYVWPNANVLPVRPTRLTISGCNLSWTDNSNNETGFKIEQRPAKMSSWKYPKWVEIATVAVNVNSFSVTCPASGYYRVRAYNATGNSGYSNEIWSGSSGGGGGIPPKDYEPAAPNTPPEVSIVSPANGEVVNPNFIITANAFDVNGNGTIMKVEFFANGAKLGEVADPPYIFVWNAPPGTYSLTAVATDASGASTTSSPVNVTVQPDLTSGLVAYWKLDESAGTAAADSSGNGHTGTLQNGPTWTSGRKNAALNFDGADDFVGNNGISDVTNNFTLAFWAFPTASHEIDGESQGGYAGVYGQRYAFWPAWYDGGQAGVGVSVGSNGVSIYEHAANYMPATLVFPVTINGWTHITLVYENKRPKLYINGLLVRTGLTSPMTLVHLNPAIFGGYVYGYYAGKLDEIKAYNRALNAAEVSALPYADGVTYVASADFSSTQGQNNWFYLDSNGNQMTYVPANSWWQNSEWSILWSSGGHPGSSFTDAVRQWVAPTAGSIHVTGNVSDADPGGGDGVIVSVKKGAVVLWQQTIANGDTIGVSYDISTSVAAGDQINFVINRNGNNMWDSTNFNPTITFTSP